MWRIALVVVLVGDPVAAHAVKLKVDTGPPRIKAADVIKSIDAAVKQHPAKDRRVAIYAVTDPIDRTAVRTALASRGYTILIDRSDQLVVEAKTHERITIQLTAGGGRIFMTPTPATPPAVPGPCVPIPQVTYDVDVEAHGIDTTGKDFAGSTHVTLATRFDLDLDGDGIDDALVPVAVPHACPESVEWRVMIVRGTCGHDVGTVSPGRVTLIGDGKPDGSGFAPLLTDAQITKYGKRGVPEVTSWTRTFAVDNGAYQQTSQTRSGGECPHCGVSRCY